MINTSKRIKGSAIKSTIFMMVVAVALTGASVELLKADTASARPVTQSCNSGIYGTSWRGENLDYRPGGWCANAGTSRAIFQSDGNLVVYRNGVATWSSQTNGRVGPYGFLSLQWDGNVVIYNGSKQPVWSTNTSGYNGANLSFVIQTDNNLVLYKDGKVPLWSKNR